MKSLTVDVLDVLIRSHGVGNEQSGDGAGTAGVCDLNDLSVLFELSASDSAISTGAFTTFATSTRSIVSST